MIDVSTGIMNPATNVNSDFWEQPTDCLVLEQECEMWKEYINSPRKYNLESFLFSPTVQVEVNPLKQIDQMKMTDHNPVTLLLPKSINGSSDAKLMRALIDSGSGKTAIARNALPTECQVTQIPSENFLDHLKRHHKMYPQKTQKLRTIHYIYIHTLNAIDVK